MGPSWISLSALKTLFSILSSAGHGGTFGVMKETHDLANKVGRPTARQIKNKNNKYMASDCPLAGKHLKQLEVDTNISNDEALHPIELMAKSYNLWSCLEKKEKFKKKTSCL